MRGTASLALPLLATVLCAVPASSATLTSVEGRWVAYDSGGVQLPAYVATARGGDKRTPVVFLPDEDGVTPDVQNAARDAARIGFNAIALDTAATAPPSREERLRESRLQQTAQELWSAVGALTGVDPETTPIVLIGYGEGGYQALRIALQEPLKVAGVVAFDTPIEAPSKSRIDARPDLIVKLARLTLPVQFHTGTANPQVTLDQLRWLEEFTAIDPQSRSLFTYLQAGRMFYRPTAAAFDAGFAELARQRWQKFVLERFD